MTTNSPVFIDPEGCGCTDCLVGEATPINHATNQQLLHLLADPSLNRTSGDPEIVSITLNYRYGPNITINLAQDNY